MKSQYRVVVIGGGVVGSSVLYHLAKMGWKDVVMLERRRLASGSSWHAAGGVHTLNADPNMAALQAYTIDLLPKIEKESGQNIGFHMTGGLTLAGTPERWEWLQSNYRIFQSIGISDCELLSPEEAQKRCPIMSVDGVLGAMWADREGYIDTTGTVQAYATAARKKGAEYYEEVKVDSLEQLTDGWIVKTDKGNIKCEHVVNAAGLWAKQVGRMAGIELPVSPLKHHYLITDSIPEVASSDFEMPMTVDLEGFTYMRQDQNGVLVGIYEIDHEHWAMDGAPWDYGEELFQEQLHRIENELMLGFQRYPAIENVGIKTWVNGAFTFSPDGNPLVGPVPGKRGYWSACAVMAGFLQGGGVGKTLAEWMIEGEPETDAWSMDVARYGQYAENKRYIRETTGQFYSRRFVMSYPNEQLPAGRPMKMAPAHDAMTQAGCRWGVSWDLEVPLYFAPSDKFEEKLTLKRSNTHEIVAQECKSIREGVALLDITGFSRFEVKGENAEAWLDKIFATKLPKPGRARLAVMLSSSGKLKGDLTLLNWGDGTFWIMGSYYLRAWHMRWFNDQMQDGVSVRDLGDDICGFALIGPNSQFVLQKVAEEDVSKMRFMDCKGLDVGLIQSRVARMSVTGEMGFELNCKMGDHIALRRILLEAGTDHDIREVGFNAMLSTRIEKSFGIWSAEFTQDRTPGMTAMDRWIDWDKPDFIGKAAAVAERNGNGPGKIQVTLEIEDGDSDASGYEPIWSEAGDMVGFVTSGAYGHTVKKSLAMALIEPALANEGTAVTVHIVGVERRAKVITPSPYDPDGMAMRS
ncbi:MAG: FAD-dependent oxidoreductase [Paracoccaceae bacterium]|uniref:GcvT family protein n=1 Tax=Candidatus Salinivivens marinus TaxID=3381703 RepID=UPI000B65D29B|nr:glycine cleavage system protein T [Marinovum sp.]OUU14765.1 MAG: glycine cleavage system protein T [Rhodobacteraceae bacterium TMED38]PDH61787.1 MAG: glycine cleavage system protein T [Rhodobacteraceae bacterium MED-G08]|tara:strand:+ start:3223 stop:5634 length:2412 start_codon:yes stop_codon:yes gene_type:complete